MKRFVPVLAVLALLGAGLPAHAADVKPVKADPESTQAEAKPAKAAKTAAKPAKTDAKPGKGDIKPAALPATTDSLGLLERAVARDSSKFDNLYRLGIMYLDLEKNDEAARVFDKANRVKPKNVKVLVNLGVAFADAGLYRDAIRMWKKVVELAPASSEAQSAKESIDVLERFLAGQ